MSRQDAKNAKEIKFIMKVKTYASALLLALARV